MTPADAPTAPPTKRPRRKPSRLKRALGVLAVIAVFGLLAIFDTTYLTPEEFRRLNPPAFNPETYARDTFPKLGARVAKSATDVTELAPAIKRDLDAAGKRYGQDLGSGNYSFPLKASGTISEVDDDFALVDVDGVPKGTAVRIPLGAAVNGSPIRDCTGTIAFGDFAGQTDYQSVSNQFKLRIQQDVLAKLDRETLKGKRVEVEGCWNTGGPPDSFIIQPTTITVAS